MQSSRPWMRQMPSATESTVPTSVNSALEVSRPSIRLLRIEVISSGLICIWNLAPLRRGGLGLRDLLSQLFESVLDRGVEDHVSDPEHHTSEDVRINVAGHLHLAVDLFADALAEAVHDRAIELDRTGDLDGQAAALLLPHGVEVGSDPEDGRHPVALDQRLQEVDHRRIGILDGALQAVLLLGHREVGREEEDRQIMAL